jgi:putative ATPase
MIYAGEDPKFIIGRLIILAYEDIGLADLWGLSLPPPPPGIEFIGLPEGIYLLTTLYLATV